VARSDLYFPTNLTILSAAVKNAGYDLQIIDLNLLAAQEETSFFDDPLTFSLQVIEKSASRIDLFGITTLCATYPFVLQLARILKERYCKPIVFGGPQATMTAQRTMELFPYIDYIVAHEGEITIVALLKTIQENRDPQNVAGIFYRRNGSIQATPFRPFIGNLDDSPFPDFGAIDIAAYQKIYPNVRIPVDIGRGCPFQCTFCSTAMMWKRSFRMKSPQRAVAEMDSLHIQFGVDYFFLTQDNLTTKKSYVLEFCEALQGKNYTWDCYSRCDTLDDEMLAAMVAAGCKHVFFGIESASEKYQKLIKKNLKLENIENAINACVKQGVSFTTSYIMGFPEEDRADLSATLKACLRDAARNPRQVKLNVLAPIPGTELSDKYLNRFTSPLAFQPDASPFFLKNEPAVEARKMIEAYPDIFSSFYFIKPTHFDLAELFDIRCFYGLMIDEFPRTSHLILHYLSMQPFDLLERYRKMDLPLKPEEMTTARMSQYFMEIIGPYCERPSRAGLFIQEILKYELAIYQARTTPTPEHLFESQSNAATLDVETLEPERLCFSPSFLLRSFKADIYKMLAALAVENHHYELLEVPLEIAFYEDAVNGDIIQEVVEAEMKKVLDDLRESQFKNNGKFKGPLPDLIKKGIVIYRKK
jgi:radical SAM superfamily enzyme YgiQ (UPF0313 family)